MSYYTFMQIPHFSQRYVLAPFFIGVEFLLCGNSIFPYLETSVTCLFSSQQCNRRTTQIAATSLTLIFQRQQQLITR